MLGPLAGIRVVELAVVVAGPATATLLSDWGADVVKVEPPEGDPQRGNTNTAYFELDNRGKRSICLDLKTAEGREVLLRLLAEADVFVTNLRTSALTRLGLDYEAVAAVAPRLVYASITGYGVVGEGADKPGYDIGALWSRAGIALGLTPRGGEPPVPRPGMGDHATSLGAAAGISAALLARERTGRGQLVTTSLLRTGTYLLGSDLASRLQGFPAKPGLRRMLLNPLVAVFRSGDERWFWLLGVQATRHWPGVCRAIGRPELADDPRFAGMDALLQRRHEILDLLDEAFRQQPMEHWVDVFAREDVWWDPLLSFDEVLEDPLVLASGAVRDVEGSDLRTVAGPVDFSTAPAGAAGRAPEAGEHTEQVLLELGYGWEQIADLQAARAIP